MAQIERTDNIDVRLETRVSEGRGEHRLETSLPGVFAVGDVRHRSAKRVASAVGKGSVVLSYVHEYLGT